MIIKSPARRALRLLTIVAVSAGSVLATAPPASAAVPASVSFHSPGNPILADGSFYSADAAPLVVGDTLYIYAGHDEPDPQQATFVMRDYGIFSTNDVASGNWNLYKEDMVPGQVFSWATGNNAYAGQTVAGPGGKYYWFAPVQAKDTSLPNPMAIGVAVSDTPVGPWTDAVGAPLLDWTDVFGSSTNGQEVIDPAIFRDDDGTTYLYWGSWGVTRVVKLAENLTETVGPITTLTGLSGFYEAPWVFKKNDTYYMAYDWKQGGSDCTPSNYQACIGYATASNPLGPWTYQGIILGGTSATTVHPSIIEYKSKWYITYHTKDAVGGGHFRRSVAIDEVTWDGAKILPVKQTLADDPAFRLNRNVAPAAEVDASFTEQPPMRLGALNDGRALTALLPPDQWGNYRGRTSATASDWVAYQWDTPVRVGGAGIQFHEDPNWVRPPAAWRIDYLDAAGDWKPVTGASYPTATNRWNDLTFDPVTTTALRATFDGAPEGAFFHSVAVSEWEVYGATPEPPQQVSVATIPGTAPALPPAVRLPFAGAGAVWAPVNWRPVAAENYATTGTFAVQGRVLGYADRFLTATVTVDPGAVPPAVTDTTAPTTSISFAGNQGRDGWYSSPVTARVAADDNLNYLTDVSVRVGTGNWTTTNRVRHVDTTIDAEGSTPVGGRAVDAAGNTSADVTRTVKIDRTPPIVSASVDPQTRAITVAASDSRSGLDRVQYRLENTGAWQTVNGGTITAPDAQPHIVAVRAVDLAGNVAVVSAVVPLGQGAQLTGNVAAYATPTASYTSGWESVNGLIDGAATPLEQDAGKLGAQWGTWPAVGQQWAQLSWPSVVTVDRSAVWWYSDAADAANSGLIPPRSWKLQYLDSDGLTWRDITPIAGTSYNRTKDAFVPVTFAPVTTRSLRALTQAWGTADSGGSVGIREWQVIAASGGTTDTTPPGLTAGRVIRTSDTAATLAFSSDEAGVFYTTVVDSGAAAPSIPTAGAGTALTVGEQTLALTTLTPGAKDVWVVGKDAAGNVGNAVKIAVVAFAQAPGAPTGITVQAGDGAAQVSWIAPTSVGSSTITAYTVTASPGGGSCSTTSATSCSVAGLTNGTAYTFTVTASNTAGTSVASAVSASVTPVSPPTSPTAAVTLTTGSPVTADGWYNTTVVVRADVPAGTTGYQVQLSVDGGAWRTSTAAITISANGVHPVKSRLLRNSVVVAGSESQQSVKVDRSAPTTTATRYPSSAGTPRNPVTMTFAATDPVSGVATVEYQVNGGTWTAGTSVTLQGVGDYVVAYRATDKAGNSATTKSVTASIRADVATAMTASLSGKIAAGTPVTLSLKGFSRYDTVTITTGAFTWATLNTDISGTARVTVVVPADQPKGPLTMTAVGTDLVVKATSTLTIR